MMEITLNVTGIGILNALGSSRPLYWRHLLGGNSGIAPIDGFDTTGNKCRLGAQIRGFDPKGSMSPRFYRRLSRLSRLAVASSIEAVQDSQIEISDHNRHRIGAVFGTAFGSTEQTDSFFVSLLENGPQGAEPFLFPDTVPNAPAGHVAIFHRIQGPNSTVCQNHLSGECALAYAVSLLEGGQADSLIVGGVDELSSILFHSLDAIGALRSSDRMQSLGDAPYALKPGDLMPGKGFIPGEGATCLILERNDTASGKKEKSYGSISALALMGARTAQGHYEANGETMALSMMAALEEASLHPDAIDIIGSAANGSQDLEEAEARALDKVFGSKRHQIPRIFPRYFTGEFGSAGLLTAATILLAIHEGVVPPYTRGPELSMVPSAPRAFSPPKKAPLRNGMVIGSTFGGGTGCLILSQAHTPWQLKT